MEQLNAGAALQVAQRRERQRQLAAEWGAHVQDSARQRAEQRRSRHAPYTLAHIAPVRDEEPRACARARALDYKEDLDVQVASNEVRALLQKCSNGCDCRSRGECVRQVVRA